MEKTKKVLYKGQMVEAIDMTPTWESLLPILFENLQSKNRTVVDNAKAEITRMAKAVDKYNKLAKEL